MKKLLLLIKKLLNWLLNDNFLFNSIDNIIEYTQEKVDEFYRTLGNIIEYSRENLLDVIFLFIPILVIFGELIYYCFTWLRDGIGSTHNICQEFGYGYGCLLMPRTDFAWLDRILVWFGSHPVAYIAVLVLMLFSVLEREFREHY